MVKIQSESGNQWEERAEFRNMDDIRMEIGDISRFIRLNGLIRVFKYEWNKGTLTNLLNYAEQKFGYGQLEEWLNIYETKNPLLKILKRPNLKGITLAKFLKEIEIWERAVRGKAVKGV